MKTNLLLTLAILCSVKLVSQTTCCAKPSSTDAFAMLTHDKKFVDTHLEPLPFELTNPMGKTIAFKSTDGKERLRSLRREEASCGGVISKHFILHLWRHCGRSKFKRHFFRMIAARSMIR